MDQAVELKTNVVIRSQRDEVNFERWVSPSISDPDPLACLPLTVNLASFPFSVTLPKKTSETLGSELSPRYPRDPDRLPFPLSAFVPTHPSVDRLPTSDLDPVLQDARDSATRPGEAAWMGTWGVPHLGGRGPCLLETDDRPRGDFGGEEGLAGQLRSEEEGVGVLGAQRGGGGRGRGREGGWGEWGREVGVLARMDGR